MRLAYLGRAVIQLPATAFGLWISKQARGYQVKAEQPTLGVNSLQQRLDVFERLKVYKG
jgi:hypothetical protein